MRDKVVVSGLQVTASHLKMNTGIVFFTPVLDEHTHVCIVIDNLYSL